MLVLKVLHLLHVHLDLDSVVRLLGLHLGVEVLDLRGGLRDLVLGVCVEVVDHVLLDLDDVSLDLGVFEAFFEVCEGLLEGGPVHGLELVVRDLDLLLLLALLSLLLALFI